MTSTLHMRPTGLLRDNEMEVEWYCKDGDQVATLDKRWITIIAEYRKSLENQTATVASSSVSGEVIAEANNIVVNVSNAGAAMIAKKNPLANYVDANTVQTPKLRGQSSVIQHIGELGIFPIDKTPVTPEEEEAFQRLDTVPAEAADRASSGTYNVETVAATRPVLPDAFGHPNDGKVELTASDIGAHRAFDSNLATPIVGITGLSTITGTTISSFTPPNVSYPEGGFKIGLGLQTADSKVEIKAEHSGFNVSYYSVEITHPKRPERAPYIFEVEDLIQALNMTFHEGTVLKSLIRSVNEREFGLTKVGGDSIRDAEKMVHSSKEILRARTLQKEKK